jgi:hypothetical protein
MTSLQQKMIKAGLHPYVIHPHFEQHIGLGFLERGHERHG